MTPSSASGGGREAAPSCCCFASVNALALRSALLFVCCLEVTGVHRIRAEVRECLGRLRKEVLERLGLVCQLLAVRCELVERLGQVGGGEGVDSNRLSKASQLVLHLRDVVNVVELDGVTAVLVGLVLLVCSCLEQSHHALGAALVDSSFCSVGSDD